MCATLLGMNIWHIIGVRECVVCGKSANKITIYQRLFIGWMVFCAMSGMVRDYVLAMVLLRANRTGDESEA